MIRTLLRVVLGRRAAPRPEPRRCTACGFVWLDVAPDARCPACGGRAPAWLYSA